MKKKYINYSIKSKTILHYPRSIAVVFISLFWDYAKTHTTSQTCLPNRRSIRSGNRDPNSPHCISYGLMRQPHIHILNPPPNSH